MRFRILNKEAPMEGFMIPAKTETWYDRSTRSWIVQTLDCFDNQIGEADYCGTRSQADACRELRELEIVR